MEAFQAGRGEVERTFGILAFADHLHANKTIEHYKGKNPKKHNRASFNSD